MKKYLLFIIVVFLCFTSCKKENKNENLYFSDTLLSQVNLGELAVHGITYNSNYLIYESTEPFTYKKFSFNDQNVLTKVEVAYSFNAFSCAMIPGQSLESDPRKAKISEYSEFEYDNGQRLTKKSTYFINNGNPQLNYYQTYDWQNGRIVKVNMFSSQGNLTQYHSYAYDDNGNVLRDDLYNIVNSVSKLSSTIICEFDNKINPYQVFTAEGIPGKSSNKNNIISETSVYYNGTAESRTTNLNAYEYNSMDYPVRINKMDCIYGKLPGK
jgi:hypothetical protein